MFHGLKHGKRKGREIGGGIQKEKRKKNKRIRGASRFRTLMTQHPKSLLQYLCESGEWGGSLFCFLFTRKFLNLVFLVGLILVSTFGNSGGFFFFRCSGEGVWNHHAIELCEGLNI